MKEKQTILLVEDHVRPQLELSALLKEILRGAHQETACTTHQAVNILNSKKIDFAFVDIDLPDGSGINLSKIIRQKHPYALVVISTSSAEQQHIFNALRAGVDGYLLKNQSRVHLFSQLKGVVDGVPPLSPLITKSILAYFYEPSAMEFPDLTPRETEVLVLLAKGMLRTEVATLLNISPNTVASYRRSIYQKLGVHNGSEATLEAVKMGLIMVNNRETDRLLLKPNKWSAAPLAEGG